MTTTTTSSAATTTSGRRAPDGSLAHIPGSGSLLELVTMLRDPLGFLRERHARYGGVFKTRLIAPIVVLVGPEANRAVLITERDAFSYRGAYGEIAFGRVFDGSLLVLDGDEHKHDRDILQPAVGRLGLSHSLERVQQIWSRAAEDLAGREVDAYDFMRDVTFEVSANALIDLQLDELDEWRPLFEALLGAAMANTTVRFPFGALDKGLRAREELIERLTPRIEDARRREPNGMVGLLAHHRDEEGHPIPTRRIAEHLLLLFWAGYDTTAATGAWVLRTLAREPAWQARLVEEQRRVLAGRALGVEDGEALAEHGWFLKEVERLYPIVIFFPRRCVRDVEILGKRIPAGTMIFYSPYLTHHDDETWADAQRFDPERFAPSPGRKAPTTTALVGFGGGPRICLGKAFALLQLRVMLTTLLSRFEVSLVDEGRAGVIALPTHRPRDTTLRFTARGP